MTEKLQDIFPEELQKYYKENKSEITPGLLDSLRAHGNEGKKLALEILDLIKDSEGYYLDAFDNRISNNGNRRIKKSLTKLPLHEIHVQEIIKCAADVHYFKDNYIRIRTKAGVNFPELREYQNEFINNIIPEENESIIGLMGRQCCTSATELKIKDKSFEAVLTFEELFNSCKKDSYELITEHA